MTSCISGSGGNNQIIGENDYVALQNDYNFIFLGEAFQDLQEAVGLIENPTDDRSVTVAMTVGRLIGLLTRYHDRQLEKDEMEKLEAICFWYNRNTANGRIKIQQKKCQPPRKIV